MALVPADRVCPPCSTVQSHEGLYQVGELDIAKRLQYIAKGGAVNGFSRSLLFRTIHSALSRTQGGKRTATLEGPMVNSP